MDENESKNQAIETQENLITDAELAEIEASTVNFSNKITEESAPREVNFRHPQQILTNKEIQILFEKKGKVDQENAEREKKGEEPIEGLTEIEKGAIQLFLIRAQHHGSKPKLNLSTKQRKARKKKRSISKASRKANR
jgi:hypothetical protein